MAPNSPESTPSRPSGMKSMLARLRGMAEAVMPKTEDTPGEPAAAIDTPAQASPNVPVAVPVEPTAGVVPEAEPVTAAEPVEPEDAATAVTEPIIPVVEGQPAPPPVAKLCPHCQAPRNGSATYCENCGWVFPPGSETDAAEDAATVPLAEMACDPPPSRLRDRYEVRELFAEYGGMARYRGFDHGAGTPQPAPVVIVRSPLPDAPEDVPAATEVTPAANGDGDDNDIMPSFDEPLATQQATEIFRGKPEWPSVPWERTLLSKARHPSLPGLLDTFTEDGWEYLIEEALSGPSLWDAWDDPQATNERRFAWLKQIAEGLHRLHLAGALLEGLRPDIIAINDKGQAVITNLADMLPLPLPPNPPLRATLYSAPELVLASEQADARSDLYSFGAMMYALHVGRELTEMDFERPGVPKAFIPRFPDVHPTLGRLISKTFCRSLDQRFPSDEASKEDASGFTELIRALDVCRRTLDNVRLEIAAWTTTGMVRTGNEDAFALLHGLESRQDDLGEAALVLLADGMGGYEAGEIAAALTIQALRKNLLGQKPFALLAGGSGFPPEGRKPEDTPRPDVESCKQMLYAALKDANKQVHTAARGGVGRRGMGCTAEAVYVNCREVMVGHVGDSRTYHLHEGNLIQLTRDQTLVNRLVELGQLKPEDAETHPRRSELQQAIGGRSDVEPALYHGILKPGDWVVVCSDGVSNHITAAELKQMLQSEATSAEMAARRLVNFVNVKGATDNATVVVIRAT